MKRPLRFTVSALALGLAGGAACAQDPFIGQLLPTSNGFCPEYTVDADGQLLSVADQPALYSLLGCRFGGDCRTTFGVPDMRARTPLGAGTAQDGTVFALAETGGAPRVTLGIAQMGPHTHALNGSAGDPEVRSPRNALLPTSPVGRPFYARNLEPTDGVAMSAHAVGDWGEGQSFDNYHPAQVINYCIAVNGVFPSRN